VPLPLPPCLSSWGWQGSTSCLLDFELAGAAAVGACSLLLRACAWRSRDGARAAAEALAAECLRLGAILENIPLLQQQRQQQQQSACVDLSFLLPASPMSSWPTALQVICRATLVRDVCHLVLFVLSSSLPMSRAMQGAVLSLSASRWTLELCVEVQFVTCDVCHVTCDLCYVILGKSLLTSFRVPPWL
jgi:hypothetical protein